MLLAVAAGAFGAHALRGNLPPDLLDIFEVGVRYQAYHALGLIVVAGLLRRREASGVSGMHRGQYRGSSRAPIPGPDTGADRRQGGPARALRLAAIAFTVGTVFFSGSLYVLALSGARWMGAITPLGGVLFLVGWAALLWYALRAAAAPRAGA